MKILMAADTYRPRVNGVVTSIDTFSYEYRKLGHEVTIVAPEYPATQKDVKDDLDKENEKFVIRLPSRYVFFDPEDRWARTHTGEARKIIKEKILTQKFDIIHSHVPGPLGNAAISWAKSMNCPVVNTYHTLFEQYVHYIKIIPRKIGSWLARIISRDFCNKHDLIICPSTQMKQTLISYGVRKDLPIEVNPTGIKIEKFTNCNGDAFRQKYGISKDTILLLFMGRIGFEKNIPFLFKMLKRVLKEKPNTKLIVAGKGPAESAVQQAAKDEGVFENVIFMGYFEPQDWVNCYAAADLFTFASVTETQGLVVTEAMAARTPVVAIAEMGVAEVMAAGKGGIATRHDLNEFTDAVLKMLNDKELYQKKKAETYDYAKEWSSTAMAIKQLKIYEKAIEIHKQKIKK
ncbi:MAG: glycosyltransferase [Candidatus Goldbacteria bacterium]|nr:glycosyltransferase [Candidatus Goldiibacteriota bacterium]